MKNIKNVFLGIVLVLSSVFIINVDAAVIEDADSFIGGGDVYLIGSTKFDDDYVITGTRAYEAGINEVMLYNAMNLDLEDIDKTTYYFSRTTNKWYAKDENGVPQKLNEEQQEKFDNGIQVVFINNKVKMVEFEYSGDVDEESLSDNITYNGTAFSVPANITDFSFAIKTQGGYQHLNVLINRDSNYVGTPGTFYIPNYVKVYVGSQQVNTLITNNDNKLEVTHVYNNYYGEEMAVDYFEDEDGNKIDFATKTFVDGEVIYAFVSECVAYNNERNIGINSFVEAIKTSTVDNPVVLNKNVVVSELIKLDEENSTPMYLDLNGYKLSRDGGGFVLYITGKNNNLTIQDGIIENTSGTAITVGSFDNRDDLNIRLNIGNNAVIKTSAIGIAARDNNVTVDFNGVINLTGDNASGISGSGLDKNGGVILNINEYSQIIAEENTIGTVGVYAPNAGVTNIQDAYISADTAVGIKAGTLNISGSSLFSNGTRVEPTLNNNGINATGDVIYVEMNPNYADNIKINITNSTLTSNNASPILVYNPTGMDEPEIISDKYGAMTINEDEKTTIYTENSNAVISVGNKLYTEENFVDAIYKSTKDAPATLLKELAVEKLINLDKEHSTPMYLDLGGYVLSRNTGKFVIYMTGKNNNLTIQNGTIYAGESSNSEENWQAVTVGQASDEDQNIKLNIKEDVVINTGEIGIALFGKGAQLNFDGVINLTAYGASGISGNGSDNNGGTIINVSDKARIFSEGNIEGTIAFYLPQLGETNINGGIFNAATVVGIKAGTLNISGGEFNAYGIVSTPTLYGNGIYATGDTVYVEMNKNYDDNIKINISNAILNSDNAGQILVYNPDAMDEPEINATGYTVVTKNTNE